jgi:sulfur carrier protein
VTDSSSPETPEPQILWVNGQSRPWREGQTLAHLLNEMAVSMVGAAVERNEEVIRRGQHETCVLQAGDRLEIVRLVGGG